MELVMKFYPVTPKLLRRLTIRMNGSAGGLIERQCGNNDGQSRTRLDASAAYRVQSARKLCKDDLAALVRAAVMAAPF
jgi:hypothetical protein